MHKTKYIKTVDAEIKVFMRAQRVREGESRAEMQFTKWTAEGAVKGHFVRVFCDVGAYVSCREYEGIPPSAQVKL